MSVWTTGQQASSSNDQSHAHSAFLMKGPDGAFRIQRRGSYTHARTMSSSESGTSEAQTSYQFPPVGSSPASPQFASTSPDAAFGHLPYSTDDAIWPETPGRRFSHPRPPPGHFEFEIAPRHFSEDERMKSQLRISTL